MSATDFGVKAAPRLPVFHPEDDDEDYEFDLGEDYIVGELFDEP